MTDDEKRELLSYLDFLSNNARNIAIGLQYYGGSIVSKRFADLEYKSRELHNKLRLEIHDGHVSSLMRQALRHGDEGDIHDGKTSA